MEMPNTHENISRNGHSNLTSHNFFQNMANGLCKIKSHTFIIKFDLSFILFSRSVSHGD